MDEKNIYDDKLLFDRVAAGDEAAFTELFRMYSHRLYGFILKIVKKDHIAREFIQESFLRLWMNRGQLKTISQPSSWLFKIASNLALDHIRTEARHHDLQEKVYQSMQPAAFDTAAIVDEREFRFIVRKAVDILPEKRKEVYKLSREEGLSHQEIAEKLGITVSTVKTHLGLAMKAIREHVQQKTGLSILTLAILLQV